MKLTDARTERLYRRFGLLPDPAPTPTTDDAPPPPLPTAGIDQGPRGVVDLPTPSGNAWLGAVYQDLRSRQ